MVTPTVCMTDREYDSWQQANQACHSRLRVALPCRDCTWEFAARMRASDRCNGEPGVHRKLLETDDPVIAERRARWRFHNRKYRERLALAGR